MGRWRYAVIVVVAAYLGWGLVASAVAAADEQGWLGVVLTVVLYLVGLACGFLAWRTEGGALLLSVAAVTGLVMHGYVAYTGTTVLFVVTWLAPFRMPLWQAVSLAVLTTGGFVGVSIAIDLPASATGGIAAGLGWSVFFAAVLNQLAATKRQSAAVAAARAGEAVLAERQRMAREIHDILAHSLSAQVVHLEGTRMLLERDGDPARVLDRVVRAGELARAGLEDTRRAVAALRGESGSLAEELDSLAAGFRAATGNPCAVVVSGNPAVLSPEARLAVVRTAQEALTNVHKHAPAASVTVTLRCAAGRCELDVCDTGGRPGALSDVGSGYGLVGMRERAELIGGNLDAGPSGTGFRVLLRVPA